MTEKQKTLVEFQNIAFAQEIELLALETAISSFLEEPHTPEETVAFQKRVRIAEKQINGILQSFLKEQTQSTEYKEAALILCQEIRGLKGHVGDMKKDLTDDLAKLSLDEGKKGSVDVTRNVGIFFGIVGVFIAAQKAEVAKGVLDVNQAAEIGGIVGAITLGHKTVKGAFLAAGRVVCELPKQIKYSLTLYYVRESFKEKSLAVRNAFGAGAKKISERIAKTVSVAKRNLTKEKNNQKPEP